MNCLLIDTKNQSIKEITIDETKNKLHQYYDHIGCDIIGVGTSLPNGDSVYVDDEGLFNLCVDSTFFQIGNGQPLCGNGLVVGLNHDTGTSISCKTTLQELKELVTFVSPEDVHHYPHHLFI